MNDGSIKLVDVLSGDVSLIDTGKRMGPLAFNADGTRLGAVKDGRILIWTLPGRQECEEAGEAPSVLSSFETENLDVRGVAFCHKDQDIIGVSGWGPQSFVFKTGQRRLSTRFGMVAQGCGPPPEWVSGLRVNSDGRFFISFSYDNIVHVWRRSSDSDFDFYRYKAIRHEKRDRDDDILDVQFNSDSSQIVVTSCCCTSIYDLESGERINAIEVGGVSASFVLSEHLILVFGYNHFASLYHAELGSLVGLFGPGTSPISNARITPTERHLFVACRGGAYLYRNLFSNERLAALAKLGVPRALEYDDRRRHGLNSEIPEWCIGQRKWPFVYPEDVFKSRSRKSAGYADIMGCFQSTLTTEVERVVKIVGLRDEEALKMVVEGMLHEFSGRLRNNVSMLRHNDDLTLYAEGFGQIVNTLNRLGGRSLAKRLLNEYKGPLGFSIE
jgi:hypothetical protein